MPSLNSHRTLLLHKLRNTNHVLQHKRVAYLSLYSKIKIHRQLGLFGTRQFHILAQTKMAGMLSSLMDRFRSRRAEAQSDEFKEEKERILNLPIEERRKLYKYGKRYNTLDDIPTWQQYYQENIKDIDKSKKKLKYGVNEVLNNQVSIWQGDITSLEIDCIANAANSSLLGGGGVDGAIHHAAGDFLYKECLTLDGCKTGNAKLTCGYNLPAKYIVHTVGPIGEKPDLLASCYKKCLNFINDDISSLALPCISTGVYGYPSGKAAHVAISEVRQYLEKQSSNPKKIKRIIFCLFLDKDVKIYEELMQVYFPVANLPEQTEDKSAAPKKDEIHRDDAQKAKSDNADRKVDGKDNGQCITDNTSSEQDVMKAECENASGEASNDKPALIKDDSSVEMPSQSQDTDTAQSIEMTQDEGNKPQDKQVTSAESNQENVNVVKNDVVMEVYSDKEKKDAADASPEREKRPMETDLLPLTVAPARQPSQL